MRHGFTFRPDTQDEAMFLYMMASNEYHLPRSFKPDDLIIDIGVHIGSFCYQALMRGSNHVYGFEAEPSNYECATRNLAQFGDRVRILHRAVWRSDRETKETLHSQSSDDKANTGGVNVVTSLDGPAVESIAFDDVIDQISAGGQKRIRLVKMDCEGSEFAIILTSKRLHLIDEIAGEFHEFGGDYETNTIAELARIPGVDRFTIVELNEALERAGFEVTSTRHPNSHLGLFYAVNRNTALYRQLALKKSWRSAWRGLKHLLKAS
jgi:FkbM family methyltransferase